MLKKQDLNKLKIGTLETIMLPDGYRLDRDSSSGNIYLNRGGKKRYCLSERFLLNLCTKKYNQNITLILFIINGLNTIASRLKKESNTRINIENLIKEIKKKI